MKLRWLIGLALAILPVCGRAQSSMSGAGQGQGLPTGCTSPGAGAITCTGAVTGAPVNSTTSMGTGGSPPTACGSATGCMAFTESSTAGTPTATQSYIRAASNHQLMADVNGGAEAALVHMNPRQLVVLREEFIGGNTNTANPTVGELGWTETLNGGSPGRVTIAGRPGIIRYTTAASNGALMALFLGDQGNPAFGTGGLSSQIWDFHFGARLNQTVQITSRIGFADVTSGDSPTNGIYFEVITAASAAHWFAVTRSASTSTSTDTGTVQDTSFHDFEISNDGANNVKFFIDGVLVATNTTNVPSADTTPDLQCKPTENVAKTCDADYMSFWMTVAR